MFIEIISQNKEQTQEIGALIAENISRGAVITLDGDLGAGKTTFTQGLGKGLKVYETINSPTFNILKCYFSGKLPLYHIDAYRLEDHVNDSIGLEEVIQGDGVCVIEWAAFIEKMVVHPLKISIQIVDENIRKFTISSEENRYQKVFECLKERYHV